MLKIITKYLKIYNIDIRIYSISECKTINLPKLNYKIDEIIINHNKTEYLIRENNTNIHKSFVFKHLNVLRLIKQKGPAIGDCYTNPNFRGQSIYPIVLNKLSNKLIQKDNFKKVFIIVDSNNLSSIKGIEKVGYKVCAEIISKKFLLFYFNTKIIKH